MAVLALGWRYPYLAYCLVLNVAVGLAGALRHGGRHGCGNFCPRGAFYSLLPDTGRKVPPALLKKNLSIVMMVAMFAGLAQWLRPTSLRAWGMLLYIMIAITTTIGFTGPSATRNCSSKAARPSRMRQWAARPSARDCVSALAISPLVLRR